MRSVLQAFGITFREGLETFLIVAISLAFFRKSGRAPLVAAVHWGVAGAVITSVVAASLFSGVANQSFWEGIAAVAASVAVAMLTKRMWRTAKVMRHGQATRSATRHATAKWVGVFLFTLLMITREGMELSLLVATALLQVGALDIRAGAIAGVVIAFALAWWWSREGYRLGLTAFFVVFSVCLILSTQLLIFGLQELSEGALLPRHAGLQWAADAWGPDGIYGQYSIYLLLAIPVTWRMSAIFLAHGKAADHRIAHVGR